MGLFRKLHDRMQASVEGARQEAHDTALQAGASEDARAAGDKAARRRRRRQAAIIGANSSGGA